MLGQRITQLPQDDVRVRFAQRQDPISVRLDGWRAVIPTRRLGCDPPLLPEVVVPADRAGRGGAERVRSALRPTCAESSGAERRSWPGDATGRQS